MKINWNSRTMKFVEGAILAGGASAYPVIYHLHHGMTVKAAACIVGAAFIGGAVKWIKQNTSPNILASQVVSVTDGPYGASAPYKVEPANKI